MTDERTVVPNPPASILPVFKIIPALLAALLFNYLVVFRQLDLYYIDGAGMAMIQGFAIDVAVIFLFVTAMVAVPAPGAAVGIFTAGLTGALFLTIADGLCFYFSLSRLNSGILHDINVYSVKAVLTGGDVAILTLLFALIGVFAWYSLRVADFYKKHVDPSDGKRHLAIVLGVVLCGFAAQLIPLNLSEPTEAPLWTGELAQLNKNSFLQNLGAGVFKSIWSARQSGSTIEFQPYNQQEKDELLTMGLLNEPRPPTAKVERPFKRVVILVHESLALNYLHSVNPEIPAAASDYLDELMQKYPAAKDFRGSAYPTLQGLIAILCSRVPPEYHLVKATAGRSIYHLMKEQHQSEGFLITGNSRFYGGENVIFKNILGVDNYISYEDLTAEYPEPALNDWGYHDDVVFEKTARVMKENRDRSYLMLAKTIDMHQPPSYCGIPTAELPAEVASHSSQIVRSIYWTNQTLRRFFAAIEKDGLLDPETLVIITADHYPMPNYGHTDLIKGEYYLFSRLPLIFVSNRPELFAGYKPDQLSCQLDLARAICHLTGTVPAEAFMGYNLLETAAVPRALGYYNNVFNLETASGALNFPVNLSAKQYPAIARWINNTRAMPLHKQAD